MQAELRINRTPVSPNRKCEGCCHYDGNAISKGGACEVGTQPAMCGAGAQPRFGYAPLSEMAPDMVDSFATPALSGSPGAMNETGQLEKPITMKHVVLGSEELSIANRLKGKQMSMFKGGEAATIGQTSRFSPDGHVAHPRHMDEPTTLDLAKSLYTQGLSPRQQHKFSLRQVLEFLGENGYEVTPQDLEAVE